MRTARKSTARGNSKESAIFTFDQCRDWQISFTLRMPPKELFTMLHQLFRDHPHVAARMRNIRAHSSSI